MYAGLESNGKPTLDSEFIIQKLIILVGSIAAIESLRRKYVWRSLKCVHLVDGMMTRFDTRISEVGATKIRLSSIA